MIDLVNIGEYICGVKSLVGWWCDNSWLNDSESGFFSIVE